MNVLEIIKQYLKEKGYDGLYSDIGECACTIEEVENCGCIGEECMPGYLQECEEGNEYDYSIVPYKPCKYKELP